MFLKFAYFPFIFFLLTLLPSSYAHASVTPQLGVNRPPNKLDVKRPSDNQPCGNGVNIAGALDTSTAVPASTNGDVVVSVLNFNSGPDGSRQVKAKVDPTGIGKNFVKMSITLNGDAVPDDTRPQKVVAKLPAGTKCTGGSKKDRCLVQFITNGGFGNCVVVSQSPDNKAGDKRGGNEDLNNVATAKSDLKQGDKEGKNDGEKKGDDKGKKDGTKNGGNKKQKKKGNKKKQSGTRAPRALLADVGR